MKGNEKIIDVLNGLLSDELTAINQYMVHAEICGDWRYDRLHEVVEKRAIDEMKHAEKLIARILFLEGIPIVSRLKEMRIGSEVEKQLASDHKIEEDAIVAYNSGIKQAVEMGDNGTKEILESILRDEESHIDWIEAQGDQIKQIGINNYLAEQMKD